jgi:hypothetical protein
MTMFEDGRIKAARQLVQFVPFSKEENKAVQGLLARTKEAKIVGVIRDAHQQSELLLTQLETPRPEFRPALYFATVVANGAVPPVPYLALGTLCQKPFYIRSVPDDAPAGFGKPRLWIGLLLLTCGLGVGVGLISALRRSRRSHSSKPA